MKKKFLGRLLTMLLVAAMVFTLLPASAIAADWWGDNGVSVQSSDSQPFANDSGNHYRIPAIVTLNDGTLVAAADQRNRAWGTPDDCRDIDTKVAISTDNGASWLTDNIVNDTGVNAPTGNSYGSGTYIDPALATDGKTVYMLVDLFPGTSSQDNASSLSQYDTGVNSQGNLKLKKSGESKYNYYLSGDKIYSTSGSAVSDYTVDKEFNLLDSNGKELCNLFDINNYFTPVMTSYLVLRTSNNSGKDWSAPVILNGQVRNANEKYYLAGPGKGLVTSTGAIVFPCYTLSGGIFVASLIYSTDGGNKWNRTASLDGSSSEGEVVELADGTLRYFMRHNGSADLKYADATWNGSTYVWGEPVTTSFAAYNDADLGALVYSKTIKGNQVILVSCANGKNGRNNGRILALTVDANNKDAMTLISTYEVNNSAFSYSCMTELSDGSIGILYENGDSGGITYKNVAISDIVGSGVTFDESEPTPPATDEKTLTDKTYNVSVTVPDAESLAVEPVTEKISGVTTNFVAYNLTVNDGKHTGETVVTIPVDGLDTAKGLYGFVVENGVATPIDGGSLSVDKQYFTFTAPHLSVVGVAEKAAGEVTGTPTDVTLAVGDTSSIELKGDYSFDNIISVEDNTGKTIATVKAVYTPGSNGEPQLAETIESGKEYYISDGPNGTNYMTLSNTAYPGYSSTSSTATKWTFTGNSTDGYIVSATSTDNQTWYLYAYKNKNSYSVCQTTNSSEATKWMYNDNYGFYYKNGSTPYYLYLYIDSSYYAFWSFTTSPSNLSSAPYAEGTTEGTTAISFTGEYPGSGSVKIGNTTFNVTVNMGAKNVSVQTGKSVTYNDASTEFSNSRPSVASAELKDGKLTITGLTEGETTITTETTVYRVSAVEVPTSTSTNVLVSDTTVNSVIAEGDKVTGLMLSYYNDSIGTTDFTVRSSNGATVTKWESTDENVATVKDGKIQATGVGNCYVIAYYDDGTQTVIPVRVVSGNTTSTKRMFTIYSDALYHSQLYCAVVSGENRDKDWTELPVGYVIYADLDYEYNSGIIFAAKPDDGYALTYMGHSTDAKTVASGYFNYIGRNGNSYASGSAYNSETYYYYDYAKTGVQKNNDGTTTTVGAVFSDGDLKTAKKGIYPTADFEALLKRAVELNLDAAFHYTRQGDASDAVSLQFQIISDKLPTMEKQITSITRNKIDTPYTDGMTIEQGDTINYTITIQTYKTHHATYGSSYYGTISYPAAKLTDELTGMTGESVSLLSSSTTTVPSITAGLDPVEDKTVTVKTSFTLSLANFDKVVNGTLTNVAGLEYTYNAQYSKGTAQATADAKAQCRITVPVYIVDFGLPVTLTGRDSVLSGVAIQGGSSANNATIAVTDGGKGIVYTPNGVFDAEEDYVSLDLSGNQHYAIRVIPASNVLYEENFLSPGDGWTHVQNVKTLDNQQEQKANETGKNVFGYDNAYVTATGELGVWQATGLKAGNGMTGALTTKFYGNGFDLIGNCGPDTGRVVMLLKNTDGGKGRLVDVDTRYSSGTIYQVPLAHVELAEAHYTATIYAGGLTATTASTQSSSGWNAVYSSNFAVSSYDADLNSILAENGLTMADVEYTKISSVPAASSSRIATYATNSTTVAHDEGTHVEIDSFRVYRSSDNSSYPANEQNVTYVNVLDAVGATVTAYTENGDVTNIEVSEYEAAGGPQNEIYLHKDQFVVFQIDNNNVESIQVSLRAVNGTAKWSGDEITSNTEMYYTLNRDGEGNFTIANSSDNLLAIGNVKLPAGSSVVKTSALSKDTILASVRMALNAAPVDPEPEPPTVFVPEHFSIRDYATRFFRSKLVTLRIDFSKDVSYVEIDGRKYTPNKLASWFGYYTVTFTDTIGRNDDYLYKVVFFDANGNPSETQIVYGK